jgi:hypothetical protein
MIHLNIKKNKMRKLSWLLFTGFSNFSVSAKNQHIYTHDLKDFNKALCFNDGQFVSSQIIFEKVKSETMTN